MRTRRFELLRPDEIVGEKDKVSLVYFPLGPLEWHSYHLPYGTDPLHALAVALGCAEVTGGVVLPPFYWGTETYRKERMLKNIGFGPGEYVVGMDFPMNNLRSFYIPEDAFSIGVRSYLDLLVNMGYELIVIVNGHGGENHIRVLQSLLMEYNLKTKSEILLSLVAPSGEPGGDESAGHATRGETSLMAYLYPDCVNMNALPQRKSPLYNTMWAIVDGDTFSGRPNGDFSVNRAEDPRDSSAEEGALILEEEIKVISGIVKKKIKEMGVKDEYICGKG